MFYVQVQNTLPAQGTIINEALLSADNLAYVEDDHVFNPACIDSPQAQWGGVNNRYYHPGNGGVTQSQINVVDCATAILDTQHPVSVANSFHYQNACDQLQPGLTPGSAHVGGCTMNTGTNPSIQIQVKICCW